MQCDNSEDEMVISRILFICTYDTTMDYEQLIKNHSLGDNVNYVSLLRFWLMHFTDNSSK